MDNPAYDMETDHLDTQPDDDIDNTQDTTREEETPITKPDTSTPLLRQDTLRGKIESLYTHLGVSKGNLDLVLLDNRFTIKKDIETGIKHLEFYDGKNWNCLTQKKAPHKFLAVNTLKYRFGGLENMKTFLDFEETPPALDRSIKAAKELKSEIPTPFDIDNTPLSRLSPSVKDIRVKTREASQNTDLDMRECLVIDKALQTIQGELQNNTAKLSEIDKLIKQDTAKLKEIEDNPEGFSEEQKELYQKR